jgi:hypothetical protein
MEKSLIMLMVTKYIQQRRLFHAISTTQTIKKMMKILSFGLIFINQKMRLGING